MTRMAPREWLLSLALHLTALAVLIWLTPVHEMIAKAVGGTARSQTSARDSSGGGDEATKLMKEDPDRVQEVVKNIEQTQADKARAMVAGMLDSEKKLDDMAKQKIEAFHKEEQARAAAAAKAALDQLQQAPQDQQAALDRQKKLADQVHALADQAVQAQKSPDPAALKPVADALAPLKDQLNRAQDDIAQAQSQVAQKQDAAARPLDDAKSALPEANDAQKAALDTQRQAANTQQQAIWQQKQALALIESLIQQAQATAQLKKTTDQQQAEVDRQATNVAQQQQQPKIASTDTPAPQTQPAGQPPGATSSAPKQQTASTQQTPSPDPKLTAALQKLNDSRLALAQTQDDLKRAQDEMASTKSSLNDLATNLDATQQASRQAQDAAAKQQSDAIAKLNAAMTPKPETETADDPDASPTKSPADASAHDAAKTDPAASHPDATQAHSEAKNATAAHNPSSPQPGQHSPGDGAAAAGSLGDKSFAQLYQAAREAEQRIAQNYKTYRAAELAAIEGIPLAEAMKSVQVAQPNREPVDLAALSGRNAAGHFEAYKEQVMRANQQIASMTTLGQSMLQTALAQQHVGDGTFDASHLLQDQARFQQMKALATADKSMPGKDLTSFMRAANEPDDHPHDKHNKGEVETPSNIVVPEIPDLDYHHIKPYATRHISDQGPRHADWLYVDSWYLIGPFPDDDRSNVDTRFPPESIVDLDASYVGKYGTPIHWKYTQWSTPELRPDNDIEDAPAVYYAYTELDFDQDRDLWIATGTDDAGKMWINNVLVWDSGDLLTPWNPNQAYRKVHFSKGRNRILYRIENGRVIAAFSLLISTRPR
jgi:hypothetical protein